MHDRLKLLLWKSVWEVVPTKSTVATRIERHEMREAEISCVLCGEHPETLHELLLHCPLSRTVWNESPGQLDIRVFGEGSVAAWVQKILHPHQSIGIPLEEQHFFQIYAANAIDLTWAARNHVEHWGSKSDALVLVHRVLRVRREHKAAWDKKNFNQVECKTGFPHPCGHS